MEAISGINERVLVGSVTTHNLTMVGYVEMVIRKILRTGEVLREGFKFLKLGIILIRILEINTMYSSQIYEPLFNKLKKK